MVNLYCICIVLAFNCNVKLKSHLAIGVIIFVDFKIGLLCIYRVINLYDKFKICIITHIILNK